MNELEKINDNLNNKLLKPIENLNPRKFDAAKRSLLEFSKRVYTHEALPVFREDSRVPLKKDAMATDKELNQVTAAVNRKFDRVADIQSDIIRKFGDVYNALEGLQSEYIPAIKSSVAMALENETTIADALIIVDGKFNGLQENIEKVIEELEEIKATADIDSIKEISEEVKRRLKSMNENMAYIERFKNRIDSSSHFEDINGMWDDVQKTKEDLNTLNKKVASRVSEIDSKVSENKKDFNAKINDINKTAEKHLGFIEGLQDDAAQLKTDLDSRVSEVDNKMSKNKKDFNAKINDINKTAEKHSLRIKSLQNGTETLRNSFNVHEDNNNKQLESMKRDIVKHVETINKKIDETNEILLKKIKIAYVAAGVIAAISIIHLILNIRGIL